MAKQAHTGNKWLILSVSFTAFMLSSYGFQAIAPLLGKIQEVFNMSYVASGLLMTLAVIPAILFALPAGLIIDKLGFRKLGALATVFVAAGSTLTVISPNIAVALVGRFVLGVGCCFLTVGIPAVIAQWFSDKDCGKAMGIYAVGSPLGAALSFFSVPMLASAFGWQAPFYICTAISLVTALIFLLTVKEGPLKQSREQGGLKIKGVLNSKVLKIGVVWMLYNMISCAFLTWAPASFNTFKGLTPVSASLLSSTFVILGILVTPLFGYACDRFQKHGTLLIICSLTMGLGLAITGSAVGLPLVVSVLVFSAAAGALPAIVMPLTTRSCSKANTGATFGVITVWQNIGAAAMAPTVGFIIQTTHSPITTFMFVSSFAFAIMLVTLLQRNK
jgi:MFS family permease